MTRYAAETEVSPERSKMEIEQLLRRYGADEFISGWGKDYAMIGFRYQKIAIRFILPYPEIDKVRTATGKRPTNPKAAYEQEVRRRWRSLALAIKAKLELVSTGITTLENEFLAHVVLPDGRTMGEWAVPQIK